MKKSMKSILPVLIAASLLASCNLPATPPIVEPTFPIPNQTLTALFSTSLPTLYLSPTPRPTVTLTAAPTQTQLPPLTSQTATATVIPVNTNTPLPTQPPVATLPEPTATLDLSHRNGPLVEASYLSSPPDIDGDWNDLPAKEYPAEIVVYGASLWKGRNDLAASFRLGWDADYLYLGVKIRDDIYVQKASGENLFKGDSLEILLDADVADDFYIQSLNNDDFQLGISPGRPDVNGTKEAYLWFPAILSGQRKGVVIASSRSETDGITRVEAAIPWSIFGIKPAAGDHFGFVLSASDNDNASENLQQKMVSNAKNRSLVDPTTWGDLLLVR